MKKKYMTPNTEIAIIETPALLAGSITTDLSGLGGFGGTDDTGDLVPSSQELEDLENLLGGGLF
jgi:hypothetical protein